MTIVALSFVYCRLCIDYIHATTDIQSGTIDDSRHQTSDAHCGTIGGYSHPMSDTHCVLYSL